MTKFPFKRKQRKPFKGSIKVNINGVIYNSTVEAARELNILDSIGNPISMYVYSKCKSDLPQWDNWQFIDYKPTFKSKRKAPWTLDVIINKRAAKIGDYLFEKRVKISAVEKVSQKQFKYILTNINFFFKTPQSRIVFDTIVKAGRLEELRNKVVKVMKGLYYIKSFNEGHLDV